MNKQIYICITNIILSLFKVTLEIRDTTFQYLVNKPGGDCTQVPTLNTIITLLARAHKHIKKFQYCNIFTVRWRHRRNWKDNIQFLKSAYGKPIKFHLFSANRVSRGCEEVKFVKINELVLELSFLCVFSLKLIPS